MCQFLESSFFHSGIVSLKKYRNQQLKSEEYVERTIPEFPPVARAWLGAARALMYTRILRVTEKIIDDVMKGRNLSYRIVTGYLKKRRTPNAVTLTTKAMKPACKEIVKHEGMVQYSGIKIDIETYL